MNSFSTVPYSMRIDSPDSRSNGPKVSPSIQPLESLIPMSDLAVVFHPEGRAAAELASILWLTPVSTVAV